MAASTVAAIGKSRETYWLVDEDSILKKIRQWCEPTKLSSTLIGVGDDAAVIAASGRALVFASDLCIEQTHFDFALSSPADVGFKSIARVLSDLAAMGAAPLAATISIALPRKQTSAQVETFLAEFFEGARTIAIETGTAIAGGDLSRLDGPLVLDIAAVGELRPLQQPWLRSGARPGDALFVTGPLGAAAAALERFRRREALTPIESLKHRRPRPRFDISEMVAQDATLEISAAMDISDGLVQDAYRLCQASRCSLELDSTTIPVASNASIETALYGGDDYELLLAVPPRAIEAVAAKLGAIGARQIGTFHPISDAPEVSLRSGVRDVGILAGPSISSTGHDPFRDG